MPTERLRVPLPAWHSSFIVEGDVRVQHLRQGRRILGPEHWEGVARMTDAEKYAKVFRAAAGGVLKPYEYPDGYYAKNGYRLEDYARAESQAGAFSAIAGVFEKIAEAESLLPPGVMGGHEEIPHV